MDSSAVKITYYAPQHGAVALLDLEAIEEFRGDLATEYLAVVQGKPGGLGGGLYELYVEFLSTLALSHMSRLIIDGMAFDVIKYGVHSFVLKPFLSAYKKLKARNSDTAAGREVDIAEFKITFQDTTLVIRKVATASVWTELEKVLRSVAANYQHLVLPTGEVPSRVTIPVLEDTSGVCRFRIVGDIDETIRSDVPDYYRYWGLEYAFDGKRRVYDVTKQWFIEEKWLTLEEYWAQQRVALQMENASKGSPSS